MLHEKEVCTEACSNGERSEREKGRRESSQKKIQVTSQHTHTHTHIHKLHLYRIVIIIVLLVHFILACVICYNKYLFVFYLTPQMCAP
jgi:hypothetical protein